MQKWEYKVITTFQGKINEVNDERYTQEKNRHYSLYEFLTEIGKEGWEVVTDHGEKYLIVKRPLLE